MTTDRLAGDRNVWIATVRPDGRPHLVPVWFVARGNKWYICTEPDSVKARNLAHNPHVTLALEDGNEPYIVEGEARPLEAPPEVVAAFRSKYDWDITTELQYTQTFEINVVKRVMG